MNVDRVIANLESTFARIFPSANDDFLDSGFREAVRNVIMNKEGEKLVTVGEDSIDVEWLSFLWWVFKKDAARINDAIHGRIWLPDGRVVSLIPTRTFFQTIQTDPIVHAERTKLKDYLKHINWIYHKTQDLPNITFLGSDNIPERLYGLRESYITLLDPKAILPKEKLFDDHIQRKNFKVIKSDQIFDELGSHNDMLESQNVVIIDTHNPQNLAEQILDAGRLLTQHGRILFDIPMYLDCLRYSGLFAVAQHLISGFDRSVSSNATLMDEQVHGLVRNVNELARKDDYLFEIEEIKLTDSGVTELNRSIAIRVYLKKNFID